MSWAPLIIALYGIVVLVAAIYAYIIAPSRGCRADVWSAWSFLFPPLVLILRSMPRRQPPASGRDHDPDAVDLL